jgi:hypothetical protein
VATELSMIMDIGWCDMQREQMAESIGGRLFPGPPTALRTIKPGARVTPRRRLQRATV